MPVDFVGRERGGHRQIAAGQPLAKTEQIGHHVFVLAGEHRARAAEADGHLVGDQEHVVAARQFSQTPQVAGRMHDHAGRSLHERLDHDGGNSS